MKKLPIGVQSFSKLMQEKYIYVDKTQLIHQIISRGAYYFLARPRRFGKSLLVSTLEQIFAGNRELFEELAINSLPYGWKKYPVIKISFSDIPYSTAKELERGLKLYLLNIARHYKIEVSERISPGEMLRDIVIKLAKKSKVVILVDEYDYPILQHIHKPSVAEKMRDALKAFYSVIKGLDEHIQFAFFTGVSKFSQTSIFSGLNNLNDISLDEEYNTLLGYTHDEITTSFEDYLENAAQYNKCSVKTLLTSITQWYDGYKFTDDPAAIKLYNPFSVLLFLSKKKFANYWFATGTPTFLINLIKTVDYPVQDFERIEIAEDDLGAFDVDSLPLETILFQTGYLTISERDFESGNYILTYPNRETTTSLISHIFAAMTHKTKAYLSSTIVALNKSLDGLDFGRLHEVLTRFYAAVPYTIKIDQEKYYQTVFYLVLKMIDADIIVEEATNIGRIDAVIQTKKHIFVIEMKINDLASNALKQIKQKKYYQKYQQQKKEIILVGISFDTKQGNIAEIKHELLK
jgi:hypothetical protein